MQLAKVNCKYGAPAGRVGKDLTGNIGPVKMHLQKVQLNSGGYDSGGAYWGLRIPMDYIRADGMKVRVVPSIYWYWWNGNKPNPNKPILIERFIDAVSRDDAKRIVLECYPEATFYH